MLFFKRKQLDFMCETDATKIVHWTNLGCKLWFRVKALFYHSHNPPHSTLYPDVLKIKTIIVVKYKLVKMPFVYYLQIYKSMIWPS